MVDSCSGKKNLCLPPPVVKAAPEPGGTTPVRAILTAARGNSEQAMPELLGGVGLGLAWNAVVANADPSGG
jgi:hypothetical protein